MRGKDEILGIDVHQTRITPAYAGKRQSFWHTWTTDQDHPRLCGEKRRVFSSQLLNAGSPPPMRGKGFRQMLCVQVSGITPAYAGKSWRWRLKRTRRIGSPPPMRGKVPEAVVPSSDRGITPAYAGKSSFYARFTLGEWDHPRLCGEK